MVNNFFVLDNIYPGTYNIEIVFNKNKYKGNITMSIESGDK